jgi:hypothetical protein
MTHTSFSAKQIHEIAPLGALIRFSDGTAELPARHRRKHAAWESSNATGRVVRKVPTGRPPTSSFTLHLGDFGADVTIAKTYQDPSRSFSTRGRWRSSRRRTRFPCFRHR